MDAFYDRDAATASLHALCTERMQIVAENPDVYHLSNVDIQEHHVTLLQRPKSFSLVHPTPTNKDDFEETTIRVQGILIKKELPPLLHNSASYQKSRKTNHIAQVARQAICLTGLGSYLFDQGVKNIARIHALFQQHIPEGQLRAWNPEKIDGHLVLNSHARYFTPKRHAKEGDIQDFRPWVNKDGLLTQIQGSSFVHTSDNVVEYVGLKKESDGVTRYVDIDPVTFHIGDVVEATIAFKCLPVGRNEHQLFLSLRALTLLDNTQRELAFTRRIDTMVAVDQVPKSLKRKAAYTYEDEKRCNKMVS